MGFVLALVALVLVVVFYVTHALDAPIAIVLALLAIAILVSGYDTVTGWIGRR